MPQKTRRSNGEGTISQRKDDGRWQGRLRLPDGRRKNVYGKTKQEASKKLAELRKVIEAGIAVPKDRLMVEKYLDSWLVMVQPSLRPTTFKSYHSVVSKHLIPAFRRTQLVLLSAEQVQLLYAEKRKEGLAPAMVHHIHAILHAALERAVKLGKVARNVCDLVDAPRLEHREMQILSEEEARHFLEVATGHRLHALFVLALHTGMRQGELLALRWKDVDLKRGYLTVQQSLSYMKRQFHFAAPKTVKSRRQIYLSLPAIDALKAHEVRQKEERLKLGKDWKNTNNLIFVNVWGGPVEAANLVSGTFKPLLKKAELPNIRFHDLRHTAATHLIARGVSVKVVSEMLGHSDISITLRVYAHITASMQEAAVQAMNAIYS